MSDDYFVIRVDLTWKLWIAPFIVLILMLINTNLQLERHKRMNEFLVDYTSMEIARLKSEVQRCKWMQRMAEYRRKELLGLWVGEGDLTVATYENPPEPVDDPGGLSRRREELQ
jgi:hypothetical protein